MAGDRLSRDSIGLPRRRVYFDYNASAPLRPEAQRAMLDWLDPAQAGNAGSPHSAGRAAHAAVEHARRQVADLLGCAPGEVVFTSGATESNNLAIHAALAAAPDGAALLSSAVEHPAVLATVRAQGARGTPVRVVGVDGEGRLDLTAYRAALDELSAVRAPVVSVMAANNETGVLTDLASVVSQARAMGCLLHTDATQLVGRLPVDVRALDVDLLSLSAHKFGGPQGVGALYINRRTALPVSPLARGGGQESGWRPGTLNVAGVVGFGAAAEAARRDLADEAARIARLRDELETKLRAALPWVRSNGAYAPRLPGVASMTFPGLPAEALIVAMPELSVSEGSACASGAPEPSHVLTAMGLSREDAEATLRFSLGHATEHDDVDYAITAVLRAVRAVSGDLAATAPRPCDHEVDTELAALPDHDHEEAVGGSV